MVDNSSKVRTTRWKYGISSSAWVGLLGNWARVDRFGEETNRTLMVVLKKWAAFSRVLSRVSYFSFWKGGKGKMDENNFKEKIQSIDNRIERFEALTLSSKKNIASCFDLIAITNKTLASQAEQISEIFQMLASLKDSVEKLNVAVETLRQNIISFGETEN